MKSPWIQCANILSGSNENSNETSASGGGWKFGHGIERKEINDDE